MDDFESRHPLAASHGTGQWHISCLTVCQACRDKMIIYARCFRPGTMPKPCVRVDSTVTKAIYVGSQEHFDNDVQFEANTVIKLQPERVTKHDCPTEHLECTVLLTDPSVPILSKVNQPLLLHFCDPDVFICATQCLGDPNIPDCKMALRKLGCTLSVGTFFMSVVNSRRTRRETSKVGVHRFDAAFVLGR